MTLPYSEGTLFAVPLRKLGFAVGIVARCSAAGKVILCYFFGPHRVSIPPQYQVDRLKPSDAVLVVRVGDLSLLNGDWRIIGQLTPWKRSEWSLPEFVRKDDLSRNAWSVRYSDEDPRRIERETPIPYETALDRDAVYGAGAAELVLTKLLEPTP